MSIFNTWVTSIDLKVFKNVTDKIKLGTYIMLCIIKKKMTKRISMKHWMKLYTFCLWIIIFGIYIYWKCSLVQLNCYLYKNCSSFGEAVCIFKVKLYRCIPFTLGLTIAAKSTITIVIDNQKYYHDRLSIVDFAIAILSW